MLIPLKIRTWFFDKYEDYNINKAKKRTLRKFQDPRRVAIYSSVELTEEQKAAIDKLYLENYGEKVPHIWHLRASSMQNTFRKRCIFRNLSVL